MDKTHHGIVIALLSVQLQKLKTMDARKTVIFLFLIENNLFGQIGPKKSKLSV